MNSLRNTYFDMPVFALGAIAVMAITHIVGIIGLNTFQYEQIFESLASINLALNFLLVLVFHKPLNRNLLLFCAFCFLMGMVAEISGVNTGFPFGVYSYTTAFGRQLYGVPYIIGINWILLSYVAGVVVNKINGTEWQKILAASVLMVLIDLLLERFAIRHQFWHWHDTVPPIRNYISWFIISLVIQYVFRKLIPASTNFCALAYLVILLVFLFTDFLLAINT